MSQITFRVLTYNIHKGFNVGNRRFVLHQIREALRATHADILLLQEIQGLHQRHEQKVVDWPSMPQLEFIADGVWSFCAYGKNAVYNAGHHGNAILSKQPLVQWENINVSPFPWASRSVLHGVIALPTGQELHVICIHFGLTGHERRLQIKKLCERIDNHVPHDAPLIIAGDFNDWLGQADRLFHEQLDVQDVFHQTHGHYARTFPAWLPMLQMDRIYYRGLTLQSCEHLNHAPWQRLSDHAPLTAAFSL